MRLVHWIVLPAVAVLLAASIIVGQVVYRIDRTLLSYRYMTGALETMLDPLAEEDVRQRTVSALSGVVRRETNARMPPQMIRVFDDAALAAFDASWFEWTLTRHAYAVIGVLRGARSQLSLPVNISSFESALLNESRRRLPAEMTAELSTQLNRSPGAVDLADSLPEDSRAALGRFGGRYGFLSVFLMYVVPGLLTAACFAFRRIPAALLGGGIGYLLGGGSVLVWGGRLGRIGGAMAVRAIRPAIPRGLDWVLPGVVELFADIASGLAPYAILITIVGAVAAAFGVWLAATGRNDPIDFGGISLNEDV